MPDPVSPVCPLCQAAPARALARELFDDRHGAPGRFTVWYCASCDFGFTQPRLTVAEIGDFYHRYYPHARTAPADVAAGATGTPPRWRQWWTDSLAEPWWLAVAGQRVLDVGCGCGGSLLRLQARGAEAYGVEPDAAAEDFARALGLRIHVGFLEDTPFPGQTFDLITANQVLEHVPDPGAFLRVAASRLAPGGRLVVAVPHMHAWYRRLTGRRWIHWHVPYHLNFFTRAGLLRLAAASGLTLEAAHTATPNVWTRLQLRNLWFPHREGVVNRLWQPAAPAPTGGAPVAPSAPPAAARAKSLAWAGITIPIALVNRAVDLAGGGESLVAVFRRQPLPLNYNDL